MARITIRIDDELYVHLAGQALVAGQGTATYCRSVLERFEGRDPSGYHARFDEVHASVIQTLAILATSVGERSPDLLRKGQAQARRLLDDRGLLDPAQDRS
ncbi:hypothetical protein BV97_04109 [Novosphingobium resinovorum]|uniref:CopG family transcriptional regulator n=1 Tax=Novosphingobium resinovorum TaxID=158500 RepID=A0A031JNL6_9SPHN|nr:hypothetical protein [Novosphingobium resinovorum]EZP79346.1 hypothetical protein BV97_04109 [Novosphingobium resinovorum]